MTIEGVESRLLTEVVYESFLPDDYVVDENYVRDEAD